jgi:hypothetical protein
LLDGLTIETRRHGWHESEVAMGDKKKTKTTIVTITLEIAGPSVTAERAVEEMLDAGVLQDAINEYESDGGKVTVVSAVQS